MGMAIIMFKTGILPAKNRINHNGAVGVTVFLGNTYRRCGMRADSAPTYTQATFRIPALLGLVQRRKDLLKIPLNKIDNHCNVSIDVALS